MKASELKVGDRIRIVGIPGVGIAGYYIHRDTVRVYKRLIARKRSVRIYCIDEFGAPWYQCVFREKNGRLHYHSLSVHDSDNNWIAVKRRAKPKSRVGRRRRQTQKG